MDFLYILYKIKSKIFRNNEIIIDYYRKKGVKIGDNCLICSNILTKEPKLISIGSNVTISVNVAFVTHDNSIKLILPDKSDLFGTISIGDNCFVGENSLILYGCNIGNNVIIAAGSVVTKSWSEENIIIGGNPARKIGDWETFRRKSKDFAVLRHDVILEENPDNTFLIRRQCK
ncbi:acyltransferase [Faecalibaculum rodentium]|jgi:acetyltransferase-like isoleucine patch superfamily enzyme|uniref:acyltransferase n=1 Tax=Faecalibaculum rodentium TaxID=1702221 RepID=UPI0023F09A4C|nr:acyltransferase [Faecalibaculum rodentium]